MQKLEIAHKLEPMGENGVLLLRPGLDIKVTNMPLGLIYLASYLELKKIPVSIIDFKVTAMADDELRIYLRSKRPTYVGVSCMTLEYEGAKSLLRLIKEVDPSIITVVGGPHASSFPHEIITNPDVDIVAIGEGEKTMYEIASGKAPSEIKGIAYKDGEKLFFTEPRGYIENLDEIPIPAYHLIDMEAYFRVPYGHGLMLADKRRAQIFTTRGCPFHCNYCHNIFGKRFRARSPKIVLEEIRLLHDRYQVKEFQFEDDSFNVDIRRAKKIMDMITDSGMKIKISFPNGIRGDIADEELIIKMKQAGVYYLFLAVETADPDMQKRIGKNMDLQRLTETMEYASRNGIFLGGFFMIGFLDETKEQMLKTIDFAAKSKLHTAIFFKVAPFKGTRLYEEALEAGHQLDCDDLSNLNFRFGKVNISKVSLEELDRLHKYAYFRFYSNPRRMISLFMAFPDKLTLVKHALRLVLWRE
jgi:anaerobic magnesium-protoporphyrin IX monomethyl ester cyclase